MALPLRPALGPLQGGRMELGALRQRGWAEDVPEGTLAQSAAEKKKMPMWSMLEPLPVLLVFLILQRSQLV